MQKKVLLLSFVLVLLIIGGCSKNSGTEEVILDQTGDMITEYTGNTNVQETGNSIAEETATQDAGSDKNQIIEFWDEDQLISQEIVKDDFGFQLEKRNLKNDMGESYTDYLGSLIVGGKIVFKEYCNMGAEDENGNCPAQEMQKYVYIKVDKSSNKELYNMTGIVLFQRSINLGCAKDLPKNLVSYDVNTPITLKVDVQPFGGYGFGPGDCWSPVLNTEIYNGDISVGNFY